ncbi:hypothetical protein N7470_003257 [Penicillium chermesinum]|nr:hypothetical protein N7470_003257 [Penicillium chermesinum]
MPGCYDNRDPKLPRSQLREIGVRLSTQIDGAAHSIPHHSTQLTYRQLQPPLSGATTGYVNWFYEHKRGPASPKHLELLGTTARGCIVLRVLWRVPGSQASEVPYVSNVALCLYEHEHGRLESLRYIFVDSVTNHQTAALVRHILPHWGPEAPGDRQMETWEHGTPEYQAVLGTRIGRTVAYMILAGFQGGTRRIARISVYRELGRYMNFRFDIEPRHGGREEMLE